MIGLMHAALFWACLSSIILWVLFVYAHLFVDYVRTFIVCTTGYMFFMNVYCTLLKYHFNSKFAVFIFIVIF